MAEIKADLGGLFDRKPVKAVILTHHHTDHTNGIKELLKVRIKYNLPITEENLKSPYTLRIPLKMLRFSQAPNSQKNSEKS